MKPTTRQLPAVPFTNGAGLGPRLLNINEVAELMNVKPRFIRRLIEERRISYLKIGKFIRFDPTELDNWIQNCQIQAS